jgi:hypothetical protein
MTVFRREGALSQIASSGRVPIAASDRVFLLFVPHAARLLLDTCWLG